MRQLLVGLRWHCSCPPALSAAPCTPSPTTLCLNDSRFEVEVSWRDSRGRTGVGQAKSITADTGYFWFFSEANIELVIKVLDARSINQKYWVFFGALSSVEYDLTVKDTVDRRRRRPTTTLSASSRASATRRRSIRAPPACRRTRPLTVEGTFAAPESVQADPGLHRRAASRSPPPPSRPARIPRVGLDLAQLPLPPRGRLGRLPRTNRRRAARPADQRHRLLLVLLARQRRADDQGPRRARHQRQVLGLLRRALERGVHADRDRHRDRRAPRLPQPAEHVCLGRRYVGVPRRFRHFGGDG